MKYTKVIRISGRKQYTGGDWKSLLVEVPENEFSKKFKSIFEEELNNQYLYLKKETIIIDRLGGLLWKEKLKYTDDEAKEEAKRTTLLWMNTDITITEVIKIVSI
jgi:hypothetical protein